MSNLLDALHSETILIGSRVYPNPIFPFLNGDSVRDSELFFCMKPNQIVQVSLCLKDRENIPLSYPFKVVKDPQGKSKLFLWDWYSFCRVNRLWFESMVLDLAIDFPTQYQWINAFSRPAEPLTLSPEYFMIQTFRDFYSTLVLAFHNTCPYANIFAFLHQSQECYIVYPFRNGDNTFISHTVLLESQSCQLSYGQVIVIATVVKHKHHSYLGLMIFVTRIFVPRAHLDYDKTRTQKDNTTLRVHYEFEMNKLFIETNEVKYTFDADLEYTVTSLQETIAREEIERPDNHEFIIQSDYRVIPRSNRWYSTIGCDFNPIHNFVDFARWIKLGNQTILHGMHTLILTTYQLFNKLTKDLNIRNLTYYKADFVRPIPDQSPLTFSTVQKRFEKKQVYYVNTLNASKIAMEAEYHFSN